MNALLIGSNKEPLLQFVPQSNFLFIDDGSLELHRRGRAFDYHKHRIDPLKDISYRTACEFVDVLNAVFPQGDSTLTKATATFQLLEALLSKPRSLATLITDSKDTRYAYQMVQRVLLSPVLKSVLERPPNFSMQGSIIAKLDRAELGDFDAFVIGNLLISQFQGAICVPDFGFYAHKGHSALIRQNRLIAGVTSFEEVPELRTQLLQIPEKMGSGATPDDAKILALYGGILPGTNAYNDFIERAIRPA